MMAKPTTVRKIPAHVDPVQLEADLLYLKEKALSAGAADVSIIDAAEVIFSEEVKRRVTEADAYPSQHWPVDYPKDSIAEAVGAYKRGLVFRVNPGKGLPEYLGGPIAHASHRDDFRKVYEIAALVESAAFYCGYHLAIGLAAGNCRAVFCSEEPRCEAMIKGRACRHSYKARPSVEAAGVDARAMARRLGWPEVPVWESGFLAGLVLVS